MPGEEMEERTVQTEELSTLFLQETGRWVLMLRVPLAREQMRQPCLSGVLLPVL